MTVKPERPHHLMSIGEVSAFLRISTKTVQTYAKKGKLSGFQLGDRIWRFHRAAIEKLAAEPDQLKSARRIHTRSLKVGQD